MGHIAQDLARLSNEIAGLREKRTAFMTELSNQVKGMREGFRTAHAEMAKRVKDEGAAFVSHLRETVGGLRHEFAAENAAAHLAWFGAGAVGHRAAGRKEAGPGTAAKKPRKGGRA